MSDDVAMVDGSNDAFTTEEALLALLQWLRAQDYRFVTTTPLTHSRVVSRSYPRRTPTLPDIFGWNRPFSADAIEPKVLDWLRAANGVREQAGQLRSAIRVSSLDDVLYVHSAYPTDASDAVFFGPDTYRYCNFIRTEIDALSQRQDLRIADVGCGSGAGGIFTARLLLQPSMLLTDINPIALMFARVNAAAAGVAVETVQSDVLAQVHGTLDLVISNPPYLNDDQQRAYRHGGGALGFDLSLRIAKEALLRLRDGGRLMLYTGVAIVDGVDAFLQALQPLLVRTRWRYRELDPDVFGEELDRPCYQAADRIAAVGLVAVKND